MILGVMDDREVLFCIRKSLELENSTRAVCLSSTIIAMHESGLANPEKPHALSFIVKS